jgi:small conductance mechanosensitive channel
MMQTVTTTMTTAKVPNVMAQPSPDVEILTFNLSGPVLAVRLYCSNERYWQVYFDTNRRIRDTFTHAGFPVPEQHYLVRGSEDLRLAKTA